MEEKSKLKKVLNGMLILSLILSVLSFFNFYGAFSGYQHYSGVVKENSNNELKHTNQVFSDIADSDFKYSIIYFTTGLLFLISGFGMKFRKKWAFIISAILGLYLIGSAIYIIGWIKINWGFMELGDILLGFILFSSVISKNIRKNIFGSGGGDNNELSNNEKNAKTYIEEYKNQYSKESIKEGLKNMGISEFEAGKYLEKYF